MIGPITGGVFESPAKNYPDSWIGQVALFTTYPYLLPTLIAASILFFGAFLALFLDESGGPRSQPIALPLDTDAATEAASSIRTGKNRVSSYFANRVRGDAGSVKASESPLPAMSMGGRRSPSASPSIQGKTRTSRSGSAYGYGVIGRRSVSGATRRGSDATVRAGRTGEEEQMEDVEVEVGPALGDTRLGHFAERLLLGKFEISVVAAG